MKVIALRNFTDDDKRDRAKGEVFEVSDVMGKLLIREGKVQERRAMEPLEQRIESPESDSDANPEEDDD